MTHASLFSGIGGFDLAAEWMGWENLFHCEIDAFCRQVLEYHFPKSKSYEDIKKSNFREWRGKVDVLTGGFPCQPFSMAGKRNGSNDDRYLWPEMLRAIRETQPAWIIGENVAGILSMVQPGRIVEMGGQTSLFGEDHTQEETEVCEYIVEAICRDLEREGYSVQPFVIPACSVGAPHRRDGIWFIARASSYPSDERIDDMRCEKVQAVYSDITSNAHSKLLSERNKGTTKEWGKSNRPTQSSNRIPGWEEFPTQPAIYAGGDGISRRLAGRTLSSSKWREEAVKASGNAIVPQVAFELFRAIEKEHTR